MELIEVKALDALGGWPRGTGNWTEVNAAIVRQDPIQVIQEAGSTGWQSLLPPDHRFQFGFPDYTAATREKAPEPKARIWISPLHRRFAPDSALPKVQWHPRVLWVGIGCKRGTSESLIEYAVQKTLRSHHLAEAAIAGVATIDSKATEIGLVKFCHDRQLPLQFFSAEALSAIEVPNPSSFVETVGTSSVSEAAALLATLTYRAESALTQDFLRVAKKVIFGEESEAVTIAIAQADREYIDNPKLREKDVLSISNHDSQIFDV